MAKTNKSFNYWQWRIIIVSMVCYAIFYFVRKNFSIAMPGLTAEYGISNTSFGIIIGIGSWEGSACYPRSTFYPLSDGHSILNHRITML